MDRSSVLSPRFVASTRRRAFAGLVAGIVSLGLGASGLSGCGGGGSSASDPGPPLVPSSDVPESPADAARFLTQATFGPSMEDIAVLETGGFSGWLDWQKAQPVSLQRPGLEARKAAGLDTWHSHRLESWWDHAINSHDQLRQRVAYSLSQILVVSDQSGPVQNDVVGAAEYYDILARGSLGDFRELLEDVTLNPIMGRYLSMLKNRKASLAENVRPDENYAREIMQLFTIGLYELNPDGTRKTDGNGQFIPTYTQPLVETYARVFTGWNFANASNWNWPDENYLPMQPWESYHDTDAKTLIDGSTTPAGWTARQDLEAALDSLANHPNVGPFLGRQLIQRLVTSNPSPAYVQRVATVWNDDGMGERGNLFAVVKAILTDDEARHGHLADPEHFGKLREPILRLSALWRAFHARSQSGLYQVWGSDTEFGQAALSSPSVFNFYSPFYQPPGEMLDAGLCAPEFQITTHTLITTTTNRLFGYVFWQNSSSTGGDANTVKIQIQPFQSLAADPAALVDRLDLLLMSGQMSAAMKQEVVSLVEDTAADDGSDRVLEAIWMIVSSPEGAVQL